MCTFQGDELLRYAKGGQVSRLTFVGDGNIPHRYSLDVPFLAAEAIKGPEDLAHRRPAFPV